MKTHHQTIVSEMLARYSTIEDGELIALPEYGSNHKMRVGKIVTTLKRWSFYVAYGFFPENKLKSASRNKDSIDPSLLYAPADY